MKKLRGVPVSLDLLVIAAAEVFGVPAKRIRAHGVPTVDELLARDACAWVLSEISEMSEKEQARVLERATVQHLRKTIERCVMRRDVSLDYRVQTDALLTSAYSLAQAGIGQALAGLDSLEEARRMLADPIRAVKNAPVMVMAAIVERTVDQADVLDLVRHWLIERDHLAAGRSADGSREVFELEAAVRDALGLPEVAATQEEHAA